MALCAGVGGLELGLGLAIPDYRCVCYVEREAFPAATITARMEEGWLDKAALWDDVTTFDGHPWRGVVDLVSAGFPCQPWSDAGKKRGLKDERWIWGDIARIIREVDPRYVFLENVPGLLRGGGNSVFGELAEMGFDAEWGRFSAAGVGAPHLRWRIFILANSNGSRQQTSEPHLHEGQQDSDRGRQGYGNIPHTDEVHSLRAGPDQGAETREVSTDPDGLRREGRPGWEQRWWAELEDRGWWEVEPLMGRVVDGAPDWVDRIHACGNGVVPAVAASAYIELRGRLDGRQ